ncbi:MFS transporter-like protein [Peziza echinospora]|nr:MFS transporter-like protein [Peziza echinospora]
MTSPSSWSSAPSSTGTPQHYQTFPTKPPPGKGRPPSNISAEPLSPPPTYRGRRPSHLSQGSTDSRRQSDAPSANTGGGENGKPPGLTRQLVILAIISLAEQTALNSIAPYLPDMARGFPEVDPAKVGLYVGIIASCFAAAQATSNFFWGRLSDRIGRKPVILWGTFWTAVGFFAFGYVKTLWQAALVQAFIGLVNGNQGVVSTVLGEITDKSNQSTSFAYLPVVYGIGSIIGPLMGGLLARSTFLLGGSLTRAYPYLLPNLFAAVLLLLDFIISMIFLEESHEEAQELLPLSTRVKYLFVWLWQFTSGAVKPQYLKARGLPSHFSTTSTTSNPHSGAAAIPSFFPPTSSEEEDTENSNLSYKTMIKTPVLLLLMSFFIFNLSNITFASLYPIYISEPPPLGAGLSPKGIGLTIAFAGVAAILLQVCVFTRFQERVGNKWAFRAAIIGLAISFLAMPMVGSPSSNGKGKKALCPSSWLPYAEISGVLLVKSMATVVGLTSSMLMFTNASPDNKVLGRINGLAQTLSAAGRAVGPFLSGGLWSLASGVGGHGVPGGGRKVAWLAWGVFGAVTVVGVFLAAGIRGEEVESEGVSEAGEEEGGMRRRASSEVVVVEEDGESGREGRSLGKPLVGKPPQPRSIKSPRRGGGERESLLRPSSVH